MSLSLRDQLLEAGLITKKQAQEAGKQQHQQRKQEPKKKAAPPPAESAAQAQKRRQDQERNRQLQEKAAQKARRAEIRQLVEQNKLPKVEGDDLYNFLDGRNIRRIPVNPEMRRRLGAGELYVVRNEGRYEVVPAETAARIRERDERSVMPPPAAEQKPDDNDPYKDYVVPDDLVW
ncbi:MAG TPA: DUF2058 domain-containing protein [Nevskia sp.]|nr:DUF2058 domain-containing protein [Nevskia sp.]